jgi:hypothetical protein
MGAVADTHRGFPSRTVGTDAGGYDLFDLDDVATPLQRRFGLRGLHPATCNEKADKQRYSHSDSPLRASSTGFDTDPVVSMMWRRGTRTVRRYPRPETILNNSQSVCSLLGLPAIFRLGFGRAQ